jgi:hypothetical protein
MLDCYIRLEWLKKAFPAKAKNIITIRAPATLDLDGLVKTLRIQWQLPKKSKN